MKAFESLNATGGYDEVIKILSKAEELSSLTLRRNQKQWLNQVK